MNATITPTSSRPPSTALPPTTMTMAMARPVSTSTVGTMIWVIQDARAWASKLS